MIPPLERRRVIGRRDIKKMNERKRQRRTEDIDSMHINKGRNREK